MSDPSATELTPLNPPPGQLGAFITPALLPRLIDADAFIVNMQALHRIRKAVLAELKEDVDYGKVKGIDKPFLWQPGASKICVGFNVYPHYELCVAEEQPYRAQARCRLIYRPTGHVIYEGPYRGASIEEQKFSGRVAKRELTEKLLQEFGAQAGTGVDGWQKAKGSFMGRTGYGKMYSPIKYTIYDACKTASWEQAIEIAQTAYNRCETAGALKELIDTAAQKRAYVHATRNMSGVEDLFTQDEDLVDDAPSPVAKAAAPDVKSNDVPKVKQETRETRAAVNDADLEGEGQPEVDPAPPPAAPRREELIRSEQLTAIQNLCGKAKLDLRATVKKECGCDSPLALSEKEAAALIVKLRVRAAA